MADYREAFVGIDVAKLKNAIAIAESGRNGEIRYVGEVEASDASMRRIIQRIAAKFDHVHSATRVRPSSSSEICKRLFRGERLFAESMVVYAVDMGRRIMVLRGTVLPMYVSHAPSKLVVQRS
ncbi:hypothetical protein LJR245_007551 [Rhizobium leguminosarum]